MNWGIRINIVVEGQTEETFVRDILKEPLAHSGIYISARSVETSRKSIRDTRYRQEGKQHHIYRGGLNDYKKARRDIMRWLASDANAYVTTMFDLYALPTDFPGIQEATCFNDAYKKVRFLEESLKADINNPLFVPYIQLHEFEGLLFSDINAIDLVLKTRCGISRLKDLKDIRAQFVTPEEIDDGSETAPSKRLKSLYSSYDKVAFGSLIANRITLDTIRNECPHFNDWLVALEALVLYR
jgi:hypothetical protein